MARITVEDCLKKVPNRFLLVNMVAKRVRQIREGSEYLVNSPKNEDIVVSLREIAAGKVTLAPETPPENEDTVETASTDTAKEPVVEEEAETAESTVEADTTSE